MTVRLGWLASALTDSPTLKLSSQAKAMIKAGEPVINLTAGEPDFSTPERIVQAAHAALAEGPFGYTATAGLPELRGAIAAYYSGVTGQDIDPGEVIVSNGAKQVLFNALSIILDADDMVAVPVPYWVTYPAQIAALRARMLEVRPAGGWKVTPEDLDRAGAGKARALILNSPGNPSGAVYDRAELTALAQWLRTNEMFILLDEIYEDLVYTDEGHVSLLQVAPDLRPRVVRITGLSKSYAMTGWRVGFGMADRPLIDAMIRLQDHSTSNICIVAQKAAMAAFDCRAEVMSMRDAFRRRRDVFAEGLSAAEGVSFEKPDGAFYQMLDCRALIKSDHQQDGCWRLAAHLLREEKLATVPGQPFGSSGCLRVSFARGEQELARAAVRLLRGLRSFPG
jgi:aspartate aminotransferase